MVSILVFLEVVFKGAEQLQSAKPENRVSILVFLEVVFKVTVTAPGVGLIICFNPCFSGSGV